MNKLFLILVFIGSCIYFEYKFIPIVWVRITLYLLAMACFVFWRNVLQNKKVMRILTLTHAILNGNYSYKIDARKYPKILSTIIHSILQLKDKLVKYIFEMQVASNQISAVSQQLSDTLEENNAFTQKLYQETKQLNQLNTNSQQNITVTIDVIKDIVRIVEDIKVTSQSMQHTSTQSKQSISQSLTQILEIVSAVKGIHASIDITTKYIDKLNVASKEIFHILDTVDYISKQTHLLSLNASIESARAGVYGNGFGVVANEIRLLSEESKQAVEEISKRLNYITAEVGNVTDKMHDNLKSTNKSVACSTRVEESLNKIEQSYHNVEEMINNIIMLSEKEYILAKDITTKINNVENISKEVECGFNMLSHSVDQQKQSFKNISVLRTELKNAAHNLSILCENADINILEVNASKIEEISESVTSSLEQQILNANEIFPLETQPHKMLLDNVLKTNTYIEAIWTNDAKGNFIYSNPPAGIANAKIREWFNKSIAGETYVSQVYISAITRSPCITVSLPIKNVSGNTVGVLGADLKIQLSAI